jgi:hypothetical protein
MKDYELEDYIADLKIELDEVEMDTPRNEYIRSHRHDEDKPVSNSPTCWGTLQDEELHQHLLQLRKYLQGFTKLYGTDN